jgi:branched-chain amino acid transport system permease protein
MSGEFWLDLAVLTLVWAGIACAWNILAGYAGQFSLGYSAYIGIGAYTPALLASKYGLSPWIGMFLGALLAATAAAFISGVSLRARGPFFTLMSIAFAEVARILAVYFKGITNGSEGLMLELRPSWATLYFLDKPPYLLVAAAYAALMFAIAVGIRRSRLGFQLLALREDESAARSLGVPVLRVRVGASMISASGAALGGTILAFYTQFIDPDSTMSFLISVQPALDHDARGPRQLLRPAFRRASRCAPRASTQKHIGRRSVRSSRTRLRPPTHGDPADNARRHRRGMASHDQTTSRKAR